MNVDRHFGSFHVQFIANRMQRVSGICSGLADGNHFLLWDFDNADLNTVIRNLKGMQVAFSLPAIHIVRTSDERHYHAYCFHRVRWPKAVYIAMETRGVDDGFVRMGVVRGYFTLRITSKVSDSMRADPFAAAYVIPSKVIPNVNAGEIPNLVTYWTRR